MTTLIESEAGHREMANAIRALAMDAVQKANSGHPGMPMGMADVATVLFTKFLSYDPGVPDWPDRDRFVLSAGHGSMLLYALLHLTGYPGMDINQLENFRQIGSKTAGHPEHGHAPGIETTTGPLGQGLANAVGMALAERLLAARFGSDLVHHHTYVIVGDGCLMEGVSQEAISLAGHHCLDKLIVLFDDNGISIDGPTSLSVSDDQLARFAASGWDVRAVDGHDPAAIEDAIAWARGTDRPALVACKTVIGFGAPTKQGTASSHGAPLGGDEIAGARAALGWGHAPFSIPDEVMQAWRAAGGRGAAERQAWQSRLDAATQREAFLASQSGALPDGLDDAVNAFKRQTSEEAQKVASRKSSQMVLEVLNETVPDLLGGSADLTGSNLTRTATLEPVKAGNGNGRYIYYGVREHGMAAAMNGIALHRGFIPYGGTFLVFADYCRPAIRLAALMQQCVVYVLTHDSIGLGEDGPTHQPVEHLASLRAIPGLFVFRPADTVETAECWALALRQDAPSAIALSRQGLPVLRTEHTDTNLCARGAYVLREADAGDRQVTLVATGSEVSIAMAARETLQADGIPTAVVSAPCFELFAAQTDAYRAEVLRPGTVMVGIEAAVRQGWDALIGPQGRFIGMSGFGASGPGPELYEHFGITADAVVAAAKSVG